MVIYDNLCVIFTVISKDEKRKIKRFLKHTLMDLFGVNRETMSDDEEDDDGDGHSTPSVGVV
jgi:hypothetical protein